MFYVYLFVFLLFVLGYYIVDRSSKYETFWKYIHAIPGPKHYPIVGNTQSFTQDQVEIFKLMTERIKLYSPVFKIWSFNIAVVTITTPEDIEIILSDVKHITKGLSYNLLHEWLGTGLLTSTGSKWQKRRKILTPAFHFSILQEFINIFNKETDILVENLKKYDDKPYVNVLDPVTEFTLNSIGETSLGVDMNLQSKRGEYKKAIYTFGEKFIYVVMRPWLRTPFLGKLFQVSREMKASIKVLHDFSAGIIKERKMSFKEIKNSAKENGKRMALIDLLLTRAYEKGDIDDEGIREEVDTFMFEGHDTTTIGLSFILLALANEPKWQESIQEEIYEVLGDYETHPNFKQLQDMNIMERCIKECQRLYPSVPAISRTLNENVKTATGYIIPKGANVDIPIFFLHRSEKIWENPEKFDPDRFLPENVTGRHPYAFIPFSAGPRNCIGQRFALLEMKVALCGILRNFTLKPFDRPEDVVFLTDLVLRPENEVRVKFVPRA